MRSEDFWEKTIPVPVFGKLTWLCMKTFWKISATVRFLVGRLIKI